MFQLYMQVYMQKYTRILLENDRRPDNNNFRCIPLIMGENDIRKFSNNLY